MPVVVVGGLGAFLRLTAVPSVSMMNTSPQALYTVPPYAEGVYLVGCGFARPSGLVDDKAHISIGYNAEANDILPKMQFRDFNPGDRPFTPDTYLVMRPFGVSPVGNPGAILRMRFYDPQPITVRVDVYGFVL